MRGGAQTVSQRSAWLAFLGLAACQLAWMAFFSPPGPVVFDRDNPRYELPAVSLLQTGTLRLPFKKWAEDPPVRDLVCVRHPQACADGWYPSALYAPGYSWLIAAAYAVHSSPTAVFAVHVLLMLLMCAALVWIAQRHFHPLGFALVIAVACTYPFLAHQAVVLMSDHSHAAWLMLAVCAALLMREGVFRGAMLALWLSLATLTRPYALFPQLLLVPLLFLIRQRREALAFALVSALLLGGWAARNAYWFGRLVPMTTAGAGVSLYHAALEAELGAPYDSATAAEYTRRTNAHLTAEEDRRMREGSLALPYMTTEVNARLMAAAKEVIAAAPWRYLKGMITRAPKLWVSLGTEGNGVSSLAPLFVGYLGGLWLLGMVGVAFLLSRLRHGSHPEWWPVVVIILGYWLFLLPFPGEARRTLALRWPLLLVAAMYVDDYIERWRRRAE